MPVTPYGRDYPRPAVGRTGDENRERPQDFRFVFGIHRQIRMFPIAEHAEPLELFALDVDEFSRKRFASLADLQRRKLARLFDHFVFDR